MYYNRQIKKSVLFSGSLWWRKSVAWKRISAQKVASFHSKKYKEHHHFVLCSTMRYSI